MILFISLGDRDTTPSLSKWPTIAEVATAANTTADPAAPAGITATTPCVAVAAVAVVSMAVAVVEVVTATTADSHSVKEGMTVASIVCRTVAVMAGSAGIAAGITPIATTNRNTRDLGGARMPHVWGSPSLPFPVPAHAHTLQNLEAC